ncbi:MAG TPA: hypothetical protein VJ739_06995 [Gemmataceae bacterium]|nr:hypothetical protein [Gemmataceae bacterium]
MLAFATVVIMGVVVYVFWREGPLTAVTMFVNLLLAGLVAFNFFEPLADLLDPIFAGSVVAGYEDGLCLVGLFALTFGLLRLATNSMATTELEYPGWLLRGGSVLFGLLTGYLAAGFLVCVLQTLPWQENFLGFNPRYDPDQPLAGARQYLPPDRVWLALMRYAGAYGFCNHEEYNASDEDPPPQRYLTFDRHGSFELRYARYRRYAEDADGPKKYLGEFDQELRPDE